MRIRGGLARNITVFIRRFFEKMEEAIYTQNLSEAKKVVDTFDRFYFGAEFCEKLTPSNREVNAFIRYCGRELKDVTIISPPLTDWGLKQWVRILECLPEATEVVFNDWGLLAEISSRRLTPVLGRCLVKYKRDPRVTKVFGKLPKDGGEALCSSNLAQNEFRAFLKENRVFRAEVDDTPFNVEHGGNGDLLLSVHKPFVYVSTGRQCLVNFSCTGLFGIRECRKDCLSTRLLFDGETLIMRGNSLYYRGEETINCEHADRVVHHMK